MESKVVPKFKCAFLGFSFFTNLPISYYFEVTGELILGIAMWDESKLKSFRKSKLLSFKDTNCMVGTNKRNGSRVILIIF